VIWLHGHFNNFLQSIAVFDDQNFVSYSIVRLKKVLEDAHYLNLKRIVPLEFLDQAEKDLQDLGFNQGHKSGFFVQFYYFLQQLNCLQAFTAQRNGLGGIINAINWFWCCLDEHVFDPRDQAAESFNN